MPSFLQKAAKFAAKLDSLVISKEELAFHELKVSLKKLKSSDLLLVSQELLLQAERQPLTTGRVYQQLAATLEILARGST